MTSGIEGPGSWPLVATCTRGLEGSLREELLALSLPDAACSHGVVTFSGGLADLYRANLWLRTAMRVLRRLTEGPAEDRAALYELAASVAWEELMRPGQTLVVEAAGKAEGFRNTAFAVLTVKDAIVDRLRARWGFRPDVARQGADLRIHLHLAGRRAELALDSTGEPLSHRGYRPRGGPAPLAESLAAGILRLAGYDGGQPLLEPMCGTGTIAIEAALIATRSAPGLARLFACERWLGHDAPLLAGLRDEARRVRRPAPAAIVACDEDARAVTATRRNALAAGVAEVLQCERRDVRQLCLPGPGALLVANPPYGERLGDRHELHAFYRELGDALKHRGSGATAWLLVGNPDLVKMIGLRPSRRIVLWNGPIECRLLRFDLYEGRAKPRRAPEELPGR